MKGEIERQAETLGQRSGGRGQGAEVRRQRSEDRGQRSEDRGQRTEVRGQRSEDRGQRSEVRQWQRETGMRNKPCKRDSCKSSQQKSWSFTHKELASWAACIVDIRNAMAGIATREGQVWKA